METLEPGTACYLVSEANGTRSREVITLAAGNALPPGAVLGQVTASGEYVAFNPAANDGSETAKAVLFASVDASAAAKAAVVTARDAEVAEASLVWVASVNTTQKKSALAALAVLGIVAR